MTEIQTKSIHAEIEKAAGSDQYDARFVISGTSVDRDGDTFAASALKAAAENTRKLICLWNHKSDSPIGYWENLEYSGGKLRAYIKFASTRLASMAKQLLDDKVPLGASIGFRIKDYDDNDEGGLEFKDVELFECSIVSVPAYPHAMQVAKSIGITPEEQDLIFDGDLKAAENPKGDSAEIHPSIRKAKLAVLAANRLLRNT